MGTMNLKKTMAAVILSVSLAAASPALTVFAGQAAPVKPEQASGYTLTAGVTADVKGIMDSKIPEGTRISAVIRLRNNGSRITRVPDYELRVETGDGIVYTLQPSATNPKAIQAKEKAELGYMLTIDRTDSLSLQTLSFIHVDEYVYPAKETMLASIDISSQVWNEQVPQADNPSLLKKWGERFILDDSSSDIIYTPLEISRQSTQQGLSYLISVKAENTGKVKAYIPAFVINGTGNDQKVYTGSRIETAAVTIQPGEAKKLHFAIPVEQNARLQALTVMTPERFAAVSANGQIDSVPFNIGRIRILLPELNSSIAGLPAYKTGDAIAFDPLNQLIDRQLKVSLVELHKHENQDDGYQTVIAKFKLENASNLPIAVPDFQAEIKSADGYTYAGVRQNLTTTRLMPKLIYVINYSFNVPISENGDQYGMKLLDNQTTAPYSAQIAAFRTELQNDPITSNTMHLYPFTVKFNQWFMTANYNPALASPYFYKLKLDLDIKRENNVVVDSNFSKFTIELVDALGRTIGSETLPFTGPNRLISGEQTIYFNSLREEQLSHPLTIKIYESVDTPSGQAKRLLKQMEY